MICQGSILGWRRSYFELVSIWIILYFHFVGLTFIVFQYGKRKMIAGCSSGIPHPL